MKQKFNIRRTSHCVNNLGTTHHCLVFSAEKLECFILGIQHWRGMIGSVTLCYHQTKNYLLEMKIKLDCKMTQSAHKTNFKISCTF